MDEILANIRKIIAEDPVPATVAETTMIDDTLDEPFEMRETGRHDGVPSPSTAASASEVSAAKVTAAAPAASGPASPIKSRLADALTSLGSGPATTAGGKPDAAPLKQDQKQEASAIDEDLADLLDEPMPRVVQRGAEAPADAHSVTDAAENTASVPKAAEPNSAPTADTQPATARSSIIPATARPVVRMPAASSVAPAADETAAETHSRHTQSHAVSAAQEAPAATSEDSAAAFDRGFDPPASVRPARQRPWDLGAPTRGDDQPVATQERLEAARPDHPVAAPGNIAFSATPATAARGADETGSQPQHTDSPARIDFEAIIPRRERDIDAGQTSGEGRPSPEHAEHTFKPSPSLAIEPRLTDPLSRAEEARSDTPTPASDSAMAAGASGGAGLAGLGELASLSTRAPGSASGTAVEPETAGDEERFDGAPATLAAADSISPSEPEPSAAAAAAAAEETSDTGPAEVAVAAPDSAGNPDTTENAADGNAAVMSLNAALERVTGLGSQPEVPATAATPAAARSQSADERSLDEAAAELLRPLVREWLDKNMPRIFERALRIEMAESVKRQLAGTVSADNSAPASPESQDKSSKH